MPTGSTAHKPTGETDLMGVVWLADTRQCMEGRSVGTRMLPLGAHAPPVFDFHHISFVTSASSQQLYPINVITPM